MAFEYHMREIHEEKPATLVFLDMTVTEINHISALKTGMETTVGLIVIAVRCGSSSHFAGVEAGNIIIEVNGKPVITLKDLENSLAAHEPGEPIELLFQRVGERIFITLPVA